MSPAKSHQIGASRCRGTPANGWKLEELQSIDPGANHLTLTPQRLLSCKRPLKWCHAHAIHLCRLTRIDLVHEAFRQTANTDVRKQLCQYNRNLKGPKAHPNNDHISLFYICRQVCAAASERLYRSKHAKLIPCSRLMLKRSKDILHVVINIMLQKSSIRVRLIQPSLCIRGHRCANSPGAS